MSGRVLDHTVLAHIAAGTREGFNLLDLVERFDLPVMIPATALEKVTREAFAATDPVTLLSRIDATLGFDQVSVDALDEHRALQIAEAGSRFGENVPEGGPVPYAHAAVCAREYDCPVITMRSALWKDLASDVAAVDLSD